MKTEPESNRRAERKLDRLVKPSKQISRRLDVMLALSHEIPIICLHCVESNSAGFLVRKNMYLILYNVENLTNSVAHPCPKSLLAVIQNSVVRSTQSKISHHLINYG